MSQKSKKELQDQIKKAVLDRLDAKLNNDQLSTEDLEKIAGGFAQPAKLQEEQSAFFDINIIC